MIFSWTSLILTATVLHEFYSQALIFNSSSVQIPTLSSNTQPGLPGGKSAVDLSEKEQRQSTSNLASKSLSDLQARDINSTDEFTIVRLKEAVSQVVAGLSHEIVYYIGQCSDNVTLNNDTNLSSNKSEIANVTATEENLNFDTTTIASKKPKKSGESKNSGKTGESKNSGKTGESKNSGKTGESKNNGKTGESKSSGKGGENKKNGESKTRGKRGESEKGGKSEEGKKSGERTTTGLPHRGPPREPPKIQQKVSPKNKAESPCNKTEDCGRQGDNSTLTSGGPPSKAKPDFPTDCNVDDENGTFAVCWVKMLEQPWRRILQVTSYACKPVSKSVAYGIF